MIDKETNKAINRAIAFIERNKGLKPEPIRIANDIINGLIKVKNNVSNSCNHTDSLDKGYPICNDCNKCLV